MEEAVAVEASGRFECFGLPMGTADLSVELGAGETVWAARDVVVDSIGAIDPRLDPIDLGGRVVPIVLNLLGPDDRPVAAGRVAWRRSAGLTEDVVFGSVVPVTEGRALLLATDDVVDAVALVPGAEPEVFEGVGDGSELMLGPGTTAVVTASGPRPDPERWNVHVLLHPEAGSELRGPGCGFVGLESTLAAVLDAEGSAEIPITFPGQRALVRGGGAPRSHPDLSPRWRHEPVELAADSGWVEIGVEFPLEEFVGPGPREALRRAPQSSRIAPAGGGSSKISTLKIFHSYPARISRIASGEVSSVNSEKPSTVIGSCSSGRRSRRGRSSRGRDRVTGGGDVRVLLVEGLPVALTVEPHRKARS